MKTPKNLRILPETIWVDFQGKTLITSPLDSWAHIALDPSKIHDPAHIEEAVHFQGMDGLARKCMYHFSMQENSEVKLHPSQSAFALLQPDEFSSIKDEMPRLMELPTAEERLNAVEHLLKEKNITHVFSRLASSAPQLRERICELTGDMERNMDQYAEYMNFLYGDLISAEDRKWEKFRRQSVADLRKICASEPKVIQRLKKDEELILRAFKKLPKAMQTALTQLPYTIVTSYDPTSNGKSDATMRLIHVGRNIVHDEAQLLHVLCEEVYHALDARLQFSDREEWKQAVAREADSMTPDRLKLISKGIKGKPSVFDREAMQEDQTHSIVLPNEAAYFSEDGQQKEALVDYFHVREHLAATSRKPMSKEALDEHMAEIFPYIHPLCQQFEREITALTKVTDSSKTQRL